MNLIILVAVALFQGYHISGLELPEGITCAVNDGSCHASAIEKLANTIGLGGAKEMGIRPVDPYYMEKISIMVMDIMNITLVKGDCLGIVKTCKHTVYEMDTVNKIRKIELHCDKVECVGEYIIETNPDYVSIIDYHGNGYGSLTMEGWHFSFEHDYDFILGKDNEIHFHPFFEKAKWATSVTKATIAADNIYSGDQDITAEAVSYVNENSESLFTTFGKELDWMSMKMYFDDYDLFYSRVPARILFSDDLKPLIKKNCDYQ